MEMCIRDRKMAEEYGKTSVQQKYLEKKYNEITGWQIVNGGQTTASIYNALQSKLNLGNVFVQIKLNEIKGRRIIPGKRFHVMLRKAQRSALVSLNIIRQDVYKRQAQEYRGGPPSGSAAAGKTGVSQPRRLR